MKVTVWIESTYETGHECNTTVVLDVEPFDTSDPEAVEDWFEDQVFPETGCACTPYRGASDCGSVYEARITEVSALDANDVANLTGATYEWSD